MKFRNTDNHSKTDRGCNKLRANDGPHKIESGKNVLYLNRVGSMTFGL